MCCLLGRGDCVDGAHSYHTIHIGGRISSAVVVVVLVVVVVIVVVGGGGGVGVRPAHEEIGPRKKVLLLWDRRIIEKGIS